MNNQTYLPVNWIDGMKINKGHFNAIQNFTIDGLRDSIGVHTTMLNYGLLPSQVPIQIHLVIDSHKYLKVQVGECHGVTPNGSRIKINGIDNTLDKSVSYPEIIKELKEGEESVLLVCISVDLFNRISCGEPDPQENPPRDPFTESQYTLNLVSEEQIKNKIGIGSNYLIIGKINISNKGSHIDESYIPPCAMVSSHRKLQELYNEINRFYGQIELYAVQIEQKIQTKNQTNALAVMIVKMTDKILNYLGREINAFRWLSLYVPPAQMLVSVVGFARVLKNFIDAHSGSGKEELLNYFADWCNISQSNFEAIFSEIINTEYDHNRIGLIVEKITRFMNTLEELLSILNRLDYIGKKRDGSIFVAEVSDDKNTIQPQRSRTFLAD